MSGTTCTLVILLDGIMYYGFVGDSMACMSKVLTATSDQNTLNNDLIVTKPLHIPGNISEKMRIYSKKGEVRGGNWNQEQMSLRQEEKENQREGSMAKQDFTTGLLGNDKARVYIKARNYPGVGVSRSIGDFTAHRIGLSAEPDVGIKTFTKNNEYLIIASRALWNVMTPKEVFSYLQMYRHICLGQLSRQLANKVRDLYLLTNDSFPDITIIIQYLNSQVVKFK